MILLPNRISTLFRYRLWLLGLFFLCADCRCAPETVKKEVPAAKEVQVSPRDRAASLYVDLACLDQKEMKQEARLRERRRLFLSHGMNDPEYVGHVREILADAPASIKLAERIREKCASSP